MAGRPGLSQYEQDTFKNHRQVSDGLPALFLADACIIRAGRCILAEARNF